MKVRFLNYIKINKHFVYRESGLTMKSFRVLNSSLRLNNIL